MKRKLIVGKKAGFCMGVRRAIDTMNQQIHSKKTKLPLYTFGPLIHNKQVMELLKKENVNIISLDDNVNNGTVLIRAHGVPPIEYKELEKKGLSIVDATCPKVRAVQNIIDRYFKKGYKIAIIGDKGHAEVIGLCGYANNEAIIIEEEKDIDKITGIDKLCVVTQTTQSNERVDKLINIIKPIVKECSFFNTVCRSTYDRQSEVISMAEKVDVLIVVGGKNSGNTIRLSEISKNMNIPTYHIETEDEIDLKIIGNYEKIGITAGASTPNWLILRVINKLSFLQNIDYINGNFELYSFLIGLINSGFIAGCAGIGLCYLAQILQKIPVSKRALIICFLYFIILDIFKKISDIDCFQIIESFKYKILNKHFKYYLFFISAFISAYTYMGIKIFYLNNYLFLLSYIPFIFYIFSKKLKKFDFISSIIDPIFLTIVISYFPFIIWGFNEFSKINKLSLILFFSIIFSYYIFNKILNYEGDIIIYKNSLISLLKIKFSVKLIYLLSLIQFFLLFYLISKNYITNYIFILNSFYFSFLIYKYQQKRFNPILIYETLLYLGLLFWGLSAIIYKLIN